MLVLQPLQKQVRDLEMKHPLKDPKNEVERRNHTFPIISRMCSMMVEIKTKTKQTTATAHVGVCSRDLPPLAPAMFSLISSNFKFTLMKTLDDLFVLIERSLSSSSFRNKGIYLSS